jgi:hypothetical protein
MVFAFIKANGELRFLGDDTRLERNDDKFATNNYLNKD